MKVQIQRIQSKSKQTNLNSLERNIRVSLRCSLFCVYLSVLIKEYYYYLFEEYTFESQTNVISFLLLIFFNFNLIDLNDVVIIIIMFAIIIIHVVFDVFLLIFLFGNSTRVYNLLLNFRASFSELLFSIYTTHTHIQYFQSVRVIT